MQSGTRRFFLTSQGPEKLSDERSDRRICISSMFELLLLYRRFSGCRQRGRVVKAPDCDQHALGSKPARAIMLCPWEIYGTFSCLVVLASSSKLQSYLY